jgi:cytosine/adenosine deaminase-related metal-dependent hydrolase
MIILNNLQLINDGLKNIQLRNGKIIHISSDKIFFGNSNALQLYFENALAFPGLINSHDHLEFNFFPQLANRVYKNYMEWGGDIHMQNKNIINSVLKVPKHLRVEWGIYKNLLNGITTVVQHGEYFNLKHPLIDIFQHCYSLHSVTLEKHWKYKLNKPFSKNQPYVIHVGEGTDTGVFEEINELIKWNLFKRKLIAVHGVAMNTEQAKWFEALIWCPDSNFFLLNATANVNELKKETKILFGTDSTLSASWNIWEQLRLGRKTNMLPDEEIFNSLTCLPASVWNLQNTGTLSIGKNADVVVANMKDKNNLMNSFFLLNPEDILLVIRHGKVIVFDEILYPQLSRSISINEFSKVFISSAGKYVKGNLAALITHIKKFIPVVNFPIDVE